MHRHRRQSLAVLDGLSRGRRRRGYQLDELAEPPSLIEIANPAWERVESLFCRRRERVDRA